MSSPSGKIRRDTRVFISAVTRELGSIRKLVKKGLEDNDYHAVEQDNFPPDYRDLINKLRERIDSCDAVVHIAGHCYGAEPGQRPEGAQRRSYTQLEYDIAVELRKPVYVFLTGEGFPADWHDPDPAELRELQKAHRERLASTGRDYNPTASSAELDQKVRSLRIKIERLEEELERVDQKVAVAGKHLGAKLTLVAILVVAALGAVGFAILQQHATQRALQEADAKQEIEQRAQQEERANQERERIAAENARQQVQKIAQIEREFAERFLQQLLTNKQITEEDARQRALRELPALVKLPLAEIESLIDRKIARRANEVTVSPLDRARAALAKGDYDEVFRVSGEQKKQGRQLAMLEGTAALARFRQSPSPEWNTRAIAAFQRAMALADRNSATEWEAWADAAVSAASVLHDLGRYGEAEPLLRDCQRLRESKSGPNSPDLAEVLNNLALLLYATNRMAEAEPLYRRALVIDEQSYGPDDPSVATHLNNLALLRRATNRMAEAEPLFRRALAIYKRSYGPDHPRVALNLNNLATVLEATNRMAEAEPLYRRALTIDERSFGPDYPDVARELNNVAWLLKATNRMAEAEPLFRRALVIDERSYGPDHPQVAIRLNNLATLLKDTNRVPAAEPLMARAVRVFSQFQRSTGHEHPRLLDAIGNYRQLLSLQKLEDPKIAMRRVRGWTSFLPSSRRLSDSSARRDRSRTYSHRWIASTRSRASRPSISSRRTNRSPRTSTRCSGRAEMG
jgi:tetratricopeptide (TPR) repeat protein